MSKKTYQSPQITEIGAVASVTAGDVAVNTFIDADFPAGTDKGKLTYES